MGCTLRALKNKTETGKEFVTYWFWWNPLWDYICETCKYLLEVSQIRNRDKVVDEKQAKKITRRLKYLIFIGKVREYERLLPYYVSGTDYADYSFHEEKVKEFIEFAEQSGGFEITDGYIEKQ